MFLSFIQNKQLKLGLATILGVGFLSISDARAIEFSAEELDFVVSEEVTLLQENPVQAISTDAIDMEIYASPDKKWNMGLGAANFETRSKYEAKDKRNLDKDPTVKFINFKYKFDNDKN